MNIRYLHTMVRVKDLDKTMDFFRLLGLRKRAASTTTRAASAWCSWRLRASRNARWN